MGECAGSDGIPAKGRVSPAPIEQFRRYAVPAGIDRAAEFCGSFGRLVCDEFDEIADLRYPQRRLGFQDRLR